MRPFGEKRLNANGKVLSREDFVLFPEFTDRTPNPEKAAKKIAEAESYLEQPIPALPLSLYREFHVMGNRSNYEANFFKRRSMMNALAIAEGLEKKGRFTEKLADVVWAVLEESTWVIPAHLYTYPYQRGDGVCPVIGEETLHGIDLFSATTASALTYVKLYASEALDAISKTIMMRVEHEIKQRIIKPYLQCPFWWTGENGNKINNWAPWITSNVLFAVAIFEGDMNIRERVVNRSIATVDNFVNSYQPDGGCDEGPGYWSAAGASLLDCLEMLDDISAGQLTVYDTEIIRNIGDYIYKVNLHDNYFANFGDSGPKQNHSANLLIRYGKKCGSEFLVAFGRRMAVRPSLGVDHTFGYRGLKNLHEPIYEYESCDMPTVATLPNLMIMTAREYPDSGKGFCLAAKGGHNAESHNHNDCGNFIVYYDGKPVLIDVGVGTYTKQTFSADRYKLWFMQSGYHNLPAFDGVDQMQGRKFEAKLTELCEEKKLMAVDLTSAYPAEAGIESYTRVSQLTEGRVTVTDSFRYKTEGEHKTVFNLMTHVEPKLLDNCTIELAEGRRLTYDGRLSAEVEAFVSEGLNSTNSWGTPTLYRIKLTSTESAGEYTVTVV